MHLLHLVGIILGYGLGLGTSLIAYDCSNSDANITVISIKDIAACPKTDSGYTEENKSVWVLQRNEIGLQKVWTCLVEVTRHIEHCGMHSHGSPVAGGISSFIYTLGSEQCRHLHQDRTLKIYNKRIGGIIMNGTTTASLTILGKTTDDAKCKGSTYSENGHSWEDVIIQAAIKVTTRDYLAIVKLEEDEISLMSGVTCEFLKGYCIDSTFGETIWEPMKDTACDKDLSLLYKGKATVVTQSSGHIAKILVVEQGEKIFAISLMKTTIVCGYQVWQTEHPKILVLESEGNEYINPKMILLPQNTNLLSYINSKLLYIEQAYKRALETLYIDTIHRRCMAYREILKNRLMLAPLTPNALSSIIKNRIGYVGRVLGEALYILQCVPKVVTIRRTKYCYNELPIDVNNQSKFMAPVTHLILDQATQVMCESLTPPLYQVEGTWIGLAPDPVIKNPPVQLQPEAEPTLTFHPIQPVGQSGLYSQKEIARVQRLLTFGLEREAVQNIMAMKMSQIETDDQGYSSLNIFDRKEIGKLARNTLQQLYGWFTDIGIFFSGIIGIYIIIKAVKYLLGVILNGVSIYKTFGCGFALLASLWNTLTLFIVHHRKEANNNRSPNGNDEELGRLHTTTTITPSAPKMPITSENGGNESSTLSNSSHAQLSTTPHEYTKCSEFLTKIAN